MSSNQTIKTKPSSFLAWVSAFLEERKQLKRKQRYESGVELANETIAKGEAACEKLLSHCDMSRQMGHRDDFDMGIEDTIRDWKIKTGVDNHCF